ncbi:cystathione beta-lyase [Clostridium cavendishii DSM 21758]|uniref:cysteine-S-conjugate beta-lyase n=1 Tax=Clostridium cavendishii DSM 21758 TaxID=1121302 RepID=A0A1M6SJF8_9CLOT|nr:MalY/PatB family protein [Clostridium cavendishii]SHK44786.1 cystathione beta-lyase [Clostridium cavendishii DSM 21758]
MKYDFDKIIDRKLGKCRKWDNKILKEKFGLNEEAIPMDLADLDFECSPAIKKALVDRASLGDYGYTYAYDEYYDSVIEWNKRRYNVNLEKEWIKLTFGTVGTLHYIVQCFCKAGQGVMINTPAYDPFEEAIKRNGSKMVCSTLKLVDNRYYFDFEDIERKIVEDNVVLYILCSPQNPSGRVWSKEELHRICDICIKHNVLLVCDEIHRDVIFSHSPFTTLWNSHEDIINHSIMCISPNKGFNLGGLKSSYIIIKNAAIREKMLKYLEKVYVTSPHVFSIPAIIAAYNESEDWLDQLTDYIESNFEIVYKFFEENMPKAKVMRSDSSFLAWIDMRNVFKDEAEMKEFFIKANISVVVGSYFVQDGEGFVRLNIGCQKETLNKALDRIKKTYCN